MAKITVSSLDSVGLGVGWETNSQIIPITPTGGIRYSRDNAPHVPSKVVAYEVPLEPDLAKPTELVEDNSLTPDPAVDRPLLPHGKRDRKEVGKAALIGVGFGIYEYYLGDSGWLGATFTSVILSSMLLGAKRQSEEFEMEIMSLLPPGTNGG